MELVWQIVLAIVLCTALLAVTCSLMVAPWYVLLAALGIVLVVSQQWMTELRRETPEAAISELKEISAILKENSAIAQTNAPTRPTQSTSNASEDSHTTHLIYRGVDYIPSQTPKPSPPPPSGHLIYRGVDYVPSHTEEPPLAAPASGHLIYRGVDYVLSQDREEHSV